MKSIKEVVGASTKDLKDSRVSSALKNMASVSEQNIQSKVVNFRNKRMKVDSLLDLGDDTTIDIASKIISIDSVKFTTDVNAVAEELVILACSISINVAIPNQLVSDKPADGLEDADGFEDVSGFEDADGFEDVSGFEDADGFEDAIYPVRPEV